MGCPASVRAPVSAPIPDWNPSVRPDTQTASHFGQPESGDSQGFPRIRLTSEDLDVPPRKAEGFGDKGDNRFVRRGIHRRCRDPQPKLPAVGIRVGPPCGRGTGNDLQGQLDSVPRLAQRRVHGQKGSLWKSRGTAPSRKYAAAQKAPAAKSGRKSMAPIRRGIQLSQEQRRPPTTWAKSQNAEEPR